MSTTTFLDATLTRTGGGHVPQAHDGRMMPDYREILDKKHLSRTEHYRLIRMLGAGGQGVVYLSERRGIDNFTLPVALKIFSPERVRQRAPVRRSDGPHRARFGPGIADSAG